MSELGVVVATFNRGPALCTLLSDLAQQTMRDFEVVVVDDGSREPASDWIAKAGPLPFPVRALRQDNAGPAAARDAGIQATQAPIIVIVDDDMRLPPEFLTEHHQAHQGGADVVLGYIAPPDDLARLPFFERFHAEQLERFARRASAGEIAVRGVHLCTGNVSFKRAAYVAVGGFDKSLGHSEDRELGVRFEKAGLTLVFARHAKSLHASERASLEGWLTRSYKYGVYDSRISRRHPELEIADPWRFLFRVNPLTRPFALAVVVAPKLGRPLASLGAHAAQAFEKVGLERPTTAAATFAYGMQYFTGVRHEAGSLGSALGHLSRYVKKRLRGSR